MVYQEKGHNCSFRVRVAIILGMSGKLIKVSEGTYQALVSRASWKDTLDEVIQRLLNQANARKEKQ